MASLGRHRHEDEDHDDVGGERQVRRRPPPPSPPQRRPTFPCPTAFRINYHAEAVMMRWERAQAAQQEVEKARQEQQEEGRGENQDGEEEEGGLGTPAFVPPMELLLGGGLLSQDHLYRVVGIKRAAVAVEAAATAVTVVTTATDPHAACAYDASAIATNAPAPPLVLAPFEPLDRATASSLGLGGPWLERVLDLVRRQLQTRRLTEVSEDPGPLRLPVVSAVEEGVRPIGLQLKPSSVRHPLVGRTTESTTRSNLFQVDAAYAPSWNSPAPPLLLTAASADRGFLIPVFVAPVMSALPFWKRVSTSLVFPLARCSLFLVLAEFMALSPRSFAKFPSLAVVPRYASTCGIELLANDNKEHDTNNSNILRDTDDFVSCDGSVKLLSAPSSSSPLSPSPAPSGRVDATYSQEPPDFATSPMRPDVSSKARGAATALKVVAMETLDRENQEESSGSASTVRRCDSPPQQSNVGRETDLTCAPSTTRDATLGEVPPSLFQSIPPEPRQNKRKRPEGTGDDRFSDRASRGNVSGATDREPGSPRSTTRVPRKIVVGDKPVSETSGGGSGLTALCFDGSPSALATPLTKTTVASPTRALPTALLASARKQAEEDRWINLPENESLLRTAIPESNEMNPLVLACQNRAPGDDMMDNEDDGANLGDHENRRRKKLRKSKKKHKKHKKRDRAASLDGGAGEVDGPEKPKKQPKPDPSGLSLLYRPDSRLNEPDVALESPSADISQAGEENADLFYDEFPTSASRGVLSQPSDLANAIAPVQSAEPSSTGAIETDGPTRASHEHGFEADPSRARFLLDRNALKGVLRNRISQEPRELLWTGRTSDKGTTSNGATDENGTHVCEVMGSAVARTLLRTGGEDEQPPLGPGRDIESIPAPKTPLKLGSPTSLSGTSEMSHVRDTIARLPLKPTLQRPSILPDASRNDQQTSSSLPLVWGFTRYTRPIVAASPAPAQGTSLPFSRETRHRASGTQPSQNPHSSGASGRAIGRDNICSSALLAQSSSTIQDRTDALKNTDSTVPRSLSQADKDLPFRGGSRALQSLVTTTSGAYSLQKQRDSIASQVDGDRIPIGVAGQRRRMSHGPTCAHPTFPQGSDQVARACPRPQSHQQALSPVRVLCSEAFLDTWGDIAAELGSGRWASIASRSGPEGMLSTPLRQVLLVDTSLVDQCGVDLELPNRVGVLLFTASALESTDDAKMVVLSVARLVATGRYKRIVIFLSYDVPLTDVIARHVVQLQSITLCNGVAMPTGLICRTTSPRNLAASIAETIFANSEARHAAPMDEAVDPNYRLWAGFLLAIVPKLCATGALKCLQLSQQVAPPNVNPLAFALQSEQFRRNIKEAIQSGSPTVGAIHPDAMSFLERALVAPLKPH